MVELGSITAKGQTVFLDVDQVLVTVGGLGKFQKLFGLFLCFTVIPWTFSMLLPYFVQHDSAWRCSYNSSVCNFSGEITGSSPKDIHNYRCSLPRKEWTFTKPRDYSVVTQSFVRFQTVHEKHDYDQLSGLICWAHINRKRWKKVLAQVTHFVAIKLFMERLESDEGQKQGERMEKKLTFDLYCDKEIYSYVATSLFFLCWGIGAVALGWLADRFGRSKVIFPSQAVIIVIGLLSAFSPNIGVYIAARCIIGFFVPGSGIQLYILASEFVGPRHRPLAGNSVWLFFTLALIILGVKAYFIRQWQFLMIACTAPYLLFLAFFKLVPESIRWLRLHGGIEKAMDILRKIARINKKELSDLVKLPPLSEKVSQHKSSLIDIFRTKRLVMQTLIQGYAWMVSAMVYFGITFASDDLGGSMYRDYILASVVEFPAYTAGIYLCNKVGRKKTVSITMFFASIGCILVSFIPAHSGHTHWIALRIVCGMIGKFCIALCFGSIYTWSVELFPTTVRAQGIGFLQVTSRLGAALAPWVSKWLNVFHAVLPFSVMGGSSLIASILLLWLPETANKATAETLDIDSTSDEDMQKILEQEDTKI